MKKLKKSKFVSGLRFKRWFYNHHLKVISKFFDLIFRILFSCDIPSSIEISKTTHFPHFALGVIIHPKTKIGDNCKICQNVTIGCRNGVGPPIICNNVFIGTGAVVIGKITIGDNVKIGANSVVTKDVPNNATVVGIPGKVIKVSE